MRNVLITLGVLSLLFSIFSYFAGSPNWWMTASGAFVLFGASIWFPKRA